jgi:hypothetical protein
MTEKGKQQVKEITAKLEQGVRDILDSAKWSEYLRAMSKFHNYSANNCLLIVMQCPAASLVAGYRTWEKEFKRNVKKGEKAIRILAPMQRKFIDKDDDGNEIERKFTVYRAVPVFDVSQTEGEPLNSMVEELKGDADAELIDELVKASPVPVTFKDFDAPAYGYYSHDGEIVVRDSIDSKQKVKTLVREIAHSILHCEDGEQEDADRRTREVQAESVAYVVLNYLGIDTSDYSFGYVATWGSGRDMKELQASLEVIRKTASDIIDKVA